MLPSAWMRKTRASRSPEPGPFTGGRNHSTTRWSVFADDDLSRPPSKRSSKHRRNQLVKLGLVALLFISAFWLFRRTLTRKKPLRPPSEPTPFTPPPPLAGCFDPKRVAATQYNLARHEQGWKRHNLNAGTNIKFEMECYDFAGTIRPDEHDPPVRHPSSFTHTGDPTSHPFQLDKLRRSTLFCDPTPRSVAVDTMDQQPGRSDYEPACTDISRRMARDILRQASRYTRNASRDRPLWRYHTYTVHL